MAIVTSNIVDVVAKQMFYGEIHVSDGKIERIHHLGEVKSGISYILPGLVDAHVHIESSMLVPDEFARAALKHGVVASVSDPHEIANVLGVNGIRYMQERAALTPFNILFGAPSCVPATPFETAGAAISASDIEDLLASGDAGYLSEVMNFPGVLDRAPDVMNKIEVAQRLQKTIDGHAPGLKGDLAHQYALAGVKTDHECTSIDEAKDKISAGMKILIREGSAAKDFDALHSLLTSHPDDVMLCSDDKHPDDLMEGHIDRLVVSALGKGHDVFNVLRAATYNPIKHYDLPCGLLQQGDRFDALQIDNLENFGVEKVWGSGELLVANGHSYIEKQPIHPINAFHAKPIHEKELHIEHPGCPCRVIEAKDGQLWTRQITADMPSNKGLIAADINNDVLFLVVVNRYKPSPPAVALIKGFGIVGSHQQGGAIASSVAHDSHNIVAVGTSAVWLVQAINQVIDMQGGLAACDASGHEQLALPIAGLMSDQCVEVVGPAYRSLNEKAKVMGSQLHAPFMTLSFMSLLVIPELKLSDKGLFDGNKFEFCDLGVATESA